MPTAPAQIRNTFGRFGIGEARAGHIRRWH